MKSLIAKRSIVIGGHKTSISLEDAFWNELKMIAGERGMNLSELVSSIDQSRQHGNLSSAIRLFVLGHYTGDAERRPHPGRGRLASGARLKAPDL
jgi:predicted DNA-binding ribbon-helix-helix protein